ncbi:MAG: hypothetical protein PHQ34_11535 [Methanothrix sp.]|nr:hypothetical protein [Methanothrix sp.]
MKEEKIISKDIIQIMRNEISIVSFMLFFVTFLFKINFDTQGVYARPILVFLASSLLILYGILLRISSVIIDDPNNSFLIDLSCKLDLISKVFYIIGVFLFIISCDFLVVSIQGINSLPDIYQGFQTAIIALGIAPAFILILLVSYIILKKHI